MYKTSLFTELPTYIVRVDVSKVHRFPNKSHKGVSMETASRVVT